MAESGDEAETRPGGGAMSPEAQLNELIVPEQTIDDAGFERIDSLLDACPRLSKWHGRPRLFSLLRMAGCSDNDDVAKSLVAEGINDRCLPLSEKYIPVSIKASPELLERVLKYQPFVLTRLGSADSFHGSSFVSGESTGHRYIEDGRVFFDQLKLLGNGASAQVHRVEHIDSKVHFARKRIERGGNLKEQRSQLQEFEQELDILRRLHHRHLVRCYGSYTDRASFALLIWPIAEHDAQKPLHEQVPDQLTVRERDNLRRAFGCLTSGLVYIHHNRTRHKDIKPGNILVSNNSVYLCDFGVSMAWSTEGNSTTKDKVFKHTEKYSPREVADSEPRNTAADIWSLGCVFLEMITVIKGISVKEMENFLIQRCDYFKCYWHATDDIPAWLDHLKSIEITSSDHNQNDDAPLEWVRKMLQDDPSKRVKADELLKDIFAASKDMHQPTRYIGDSCRTGLQKNTDSAVGLPNEDMRPVTIQHQDPINLTIERIRRRPASVSTTRSKTRSPSPLKNEYCQDKPPSSAHTLKDELPNPKYPTIEVTKVESQSERDTSHHSDLDPKDKESPDMNIEHLEETETSPETSHEGEHCVFVAEHASFKVVKKGQTLYTQRIQCDAKTKVELYHDSPENFWQTTRRLIITEPDTDTRHCRQSTFWLPLSDIRYLEEQDRVILCWSDCNWIQKKHGGDWGDAYDRRYDPTRINNEISIRFKSAASAKSFIDCFRALVEDPRVRPGGTRIPASQSQHVLIYDILSRNGHTVEYRALLVIDTLKAGLSSTKIYFAWRDLDLWLASKSPQRPWDEISLSISELRSPFYKSDTLGRRVKEEDLPEGSCDKSILKESTVELRFGLEVSQSVPHTPSLSVSSVLAAVTGWRLISVTTVSSVKLRKKLRMKRYGSADVMVWLRVRNKRLLGQLTIRLKDNNRRHWIAGSLSRDCLADCPSKKSLTTTVISRSRGDLLDISKMTATDPVPISKSTRHGKPTGHVSGKKSKLVLRFETCEDRANVSASIQSYLEECKEFSVTAKLRPLVN